MANTVRIKRRASGNAGAPTSLANAELAYNEVDDVLYYGKGTGGAGGTATSIPAIGGPGAYLTLSTAQTVSGNKTFTGSVDLTGSNATAEAIDLVRRADAAGATSHLQVAPYYNKPSQEGLFRHFSAIARETDRPIVLYSIPGRCGVEIAVETVVRLRAAHANIVGIKEAGGSVEKAGRLVRELDPGFTVLSGDDALTVAFAEFGAQGIVSVASNLIPAEITRLANLCREGNLPEARNLHIRLADLFKVLFVEPNPVPVKHLLARAGIIGSAEVRLPLCEMSAANRAAVEATADAFLANRR